MEAINGQTEAVGLSVPPFSVVCEGPVIVAGNAWNLLEDIDAARAIVGDVPIIACNGAAGHIKADYLYSAHPHRFVKELYWIDRQRRFHDDFTVHAGTFQKNMPWVEHWWAGARGGGSCVWGGRKVASLMGFDMVILCGAPIEVGGYCNDPLSKLMRLQSRIDEIRREIEEDTEWHKGVRSMSGWTREFLG